MFEDNEGSMQLAQNPITNSNSKHIYVRHHFLRELVGRNDIPAIYVPLSMLIFGSKQYRGRESFEFHSNLAMNSW